MHGKIPPKIVFAAFVSIAWRDTAMAIIDMWWRMVIDNHDQDESPVQVHCDHVRRIEQAQSI